MTFLRFMKRHVEILALLATSLVTHLFLFGYPKEAVFDEVYFTSFISQYFTHHFFFDIHPPFGKLLIAGFGYMFGFTPLSHELVIGESFDTSTFIWLRVLPVIAGILLPLIIYRILRELQVSRNAAWAAGFLVVFESSLLVQSRFVLLDSLLLCFGFFGMLLYFIYLRKRNILIQVASVVFLTFAFSIKWTGATFIALVVLLELWRIFKERALSFRWFLQWVRGGMVYIVIPFAIYYAFFAIHLHLLYKSGLGDAFMSEHFQKTLVGNKFENEDTWSENMFEKSVELNAEMYRSNARLTATHTYSSKWYTWPIMARPIYYWNSGDSTTTPTVHSRIYLFGNPFIYVLGTLSIIISALLLFASIFKRNLVKRKKLTAFILAAYFFNLLPFIGITRVMFLYHYFTALIFSIIATVVLFDSLQNDRIKKRILVVLVLLAFGFFVYFSPLIYGLPIDQVHEHYFFWFKSWI